MPPRAADADVVIVGCGSAALYAVFQLGLYKLRCLLVDSLDRPGGQCAALYPDKPILDVPGFPETTGDALIEALLRQAAPFAPRFMLRERADSFSAEPGGGFSTHLQGGTAVRSRIVVVASGLGSFTPDGASGDPRLASLAAGPAGDWPLARGRFGLTVDPRSLETSVEGVYAIGDAADYPGKLKLILCGFHEAALMTQSVRHRITGVRRPPLYTTASGSGRAERPD
ncbi:NAD(P)/FAD-dependent oxidoreductase [Rhizobium sp. TRM95111]|uniref:NAD(P)/FAD-dependent oxidoreductase n=1 Tax=Rhizobium alarense TaxID=2846851 RepID=UPI001F436546|nr:NAD(P)/FAD-dependent oxidoreductase [Rhizobium alarense]MCF3642404.1 NAD(P)/FAD-dependent oxidoreductase [Rhizobium alarense]